MTQKPRKGDFRELKSKKFQGGGGVGGMPPELQETCAFGARLENRSVFILDPRLNVQAVYVELVSLRCKLLRQKYWIAPP